MRIQNPRQKRLPRNDPFTVWLKSWSFQFCREFYRICPGRQVFSLSVFWMSIITISREVLSLGLLRFLFQKLDFVLVNRITEDALSIFLPTAQFKGFCTQHLSR